MNLNINNSASEKNEIDENKNKNDIDSIINSLISNNTAHNNDENYCSNLINDMIIILSQNINQCFQNINFSKLSIQQIYNIINCNKENLNHDLLFNFIDKNIDQYFILFTFLDLKKLSNDNFNKLINIYENSLSTSKEHYFHCLRCNLIAIKHLKQKVNTADNEYLKLKEENVQLKLSNRHYKDIINELNSIKEENEQIQQKNEQIENENINIQNEINQANEKLQEFQMKLDDFTISDSEYYQGLNLILPNKTIKNSNKYFVYLNDSSENGNSFASYLLGLCYLNGYKTNADQEKAFNFFQKSANQGNPNGIYYVGVCYEEGVGVSKNDKKAFEYYQMSSELGNTDAKSKISILSKK